MTWYDGNLYVDQWVLRLIIAAAFGVELWLIYYSMYGSQGTGTVLAFLGTVLWPIVVICASWFFSTSDPELLARAGQEGYCMACGFDELFTEGPGVYQCLGCGYFGGPGLAAYQQQQRRQAEFAALPPDEH